MTNDGHDPTPDPDDAHDTGRDSEHDDAVRALLKRSLTKSAPPKDDEFLRGVQKRIRHRSRGRFFADGWSTSSQRINYAVVAGMMLILIAAAYFALGPMGISK